jgi:periodic tryptophan protein 1
MPVTSVSWLPTTQMQKTLSFPESRKQQLTRIQKLADEVGDIDEDDCLLMNDSDESETQQAPAPLETPSARLDDSIDREFNMDSYDAEPLQDASSYLVHLNKDLKLNAKKDPYINEEELTDSEDEEYYTVKATDLIFAAATAEQEKCSVDVFIHDTINGSLFVRQSFELNAFPLCTEFVMGGNEADSKALLAVGTFDYGIELWDLGDGLDQDEPTAMLGEKIEHQTSAPVLSGKKNKTSKKSASNSNSHTDAVLTISAKGSVLASGSADCTVKLWDVSKTACVSTLKHHKDKVQCVRFHHTDLGVLLSAGYDRVVAVVDGRQANSESNVIKTKLTSADPECLAWNPTNSYSFVVSAEDGMIACYDARKIKSSVWKVDAAHDGACTGLAFGGKTRDILASVGNDGKAKLWNSTSGAPIKEKNMNTGSLFSVTCLEDDPTVFAFAGDEAGVWAIE